MGLSPVAGIQQMDLHGKNVYQARLCVNAALRRLDHSVYQLVLIHGAGQGTALRDMIRAEYKSHSRVLRLENRGDGATALILREL